MVEIDENNETSQNIGLIQRKNARIAASGSLWYKLPEYNVKSGLGSIKYRFLFAFIFFGKKLSDRSKNYET